MNIGPHDLWGSPGLGAGADPVFVYIDDLPDALSSQVRQMTRPFAYQLDAVDGKALQNDLDRLSGETWSSTPLSARWYG